jgi:hypothetical protein
MRDVPNRVAVMTMTETDHGAAARQIERACESAEAGGGHEHAEGTRAPTQYLGGNHRQKHGEGHTEQANGSDEQEQRADGTETKRVAEALSQAAQNGSPFSGHGARPQPHGEQSGEYGDVAHPVHDNDPPLADGCDGKACDGWTNQSRAVEDGRIQRDGVGQIRAVVHHVDEERLASGDIETGGDAEHGHQQQDPACAHVVGEDERAEGKRLQHHDHLRDDHDAVFVVAVGENAGEGRDDEAGCQAGKAHQAQQQR